MIHNVIYSLIANLLLLFDKTIKKGDHIIVEKFKFHYVTLKTENKVYLISSNILSSKYINTFLKTGVMHAII